MIDWTVFKQILGMLIGCVVMFVIRFLVMVVFS